MLKPVVVVQDWTFVTRWVVFEGCNCGDCFIEISPDAIILNVENLPDALRIAIASICGAH